MSPSPLIIRSSRIVADHGVLDGWIRVESGSITELGEGAPPRTEHPVLDLADRWVGPGFIDLHIHGVGDDDVMDGSAKSIQRMARALADHGVTAFLPTTYSAPIDQTVRALEAITAATPEPGAAAVLGAYLEGPHLSEKRRGAHRPEFLRAPSISETERYLAAAAVRIVTVAPELDGSSELIEFLLAHRVAVSIGHTDAAADEVERAAAAGATLVTHLFNGMAPIHHRRVGPVGAALLSPTLTCELICDGLHVSADAIRLATGAKGIEGLVLVSDAGRGAGHSAEAGTIQLPDGTLAGSLSLLPAGFANFCRVNTLDFAEAWPVASANAARVLGEANKGIIRVGADADFTVLNQDGTVHGAIVGGLGRLVAE